MTKDDYFGRREMVVFKRVSVESQDGYIVCESYPPYDEEDDAVCLDKKL